MIFCGLRERRLDAQRRYGWEGEMSTHFGFFCPKCHRGIQQPGYCPYCNWCAKDDIKKFYGEETKQDYKPTFDETRYKWLLDFERRAVPELRQLRTELEDAYKLIKRLKTELDKKDKEIKQYLQDEDINKYREIILSLQTELETANQTLQIIQDMAIEKTDNVATDIANRINSIRGELDDTYAEMSKQYPTITAVYNREVWECMKKWREGVFGNDEAI